MLLLAAFKGALWQTEQPGGQTRPQAGASSYRRALAAALHFEFRPEHWQELVYCRRALEELIAEPGGEDKRLLDGLLHQLNRKIKEVEANGR